MFNGGYGYNIRICKIRIEYMRRRPRVYDICRRCSFGREEHTGVTNTIERWIRVFERNVLK